MVTGSRLTILLTLKGRDLYTLRWLWHANRVALPFPVVIADGEVNPAIARLIEDPAVFSNLQIEYRRYNDLTFHDFYLKIEDALSSIKTPYVMMSDNDDFLFTSGIIASMEFLERSPDYVSVGGGIGHFELRAEKNQIQNISGKIEKFWYQQSRAYRAYDLKSELATERVHEAYRGFLTVCYNVFRVEALRKIASETTQFDFKRLDNFELYQILRTATLGKIRSFASCMSYLRQLGTSSNPSRGKDFVATVSNEIYVDEIQKVVKQIAAIGSEIDGSKSETVAESLHAISADRLREKLLAVLGWRAAAKGALKTRVPQALFGFARSLTERFRSGRSSAAGGQPITRKQMLELVTRTGASRALLMDMQRELADVEHTMASGEFIAFVETFAPDVLRQENRAAGELVA